jgi:hypothetical protein
LNEVQSQVRSAVSFDDKYINKLLNIQVLDLNLENRKQIINALQLLMVKHHLAVDITGMTPRAIEDEFASDLPPCFREPLPSSQLEGSLLGEDANILNGIWQLFFFRPPNDSPESPLIRGKMAIIRDAVPNGTSAKVDVISEHSHWRGHCFLNDFHLYIVATHLDRIDSHFYIMNRPRITDVSLFGVGSTVYPPSDALNKQHIRPAEAYCLFGNRWTEIPGTTQDVRTTCSRILNGEPIPSGSELEKKIKQAFCPPRVQFAGMDEFKECHPKLAKYLDTIRINNNDTDQPVLRLHVGW